MDDDDPYVRNPNLARLAKKNLQSTAYRKSPKLESKLAKDIGGRRTSGSGNKHEKGDVRKRGVVRIEHKATQQKSFSVTREMLTKVQQAAFLNDELPVLVVAFLNEHGGIDTELAIMPLNELMWVLDK